MTGIRGVSPGNKSASEEGFLREVRTSVNALQGHGKFDEKAITVKDLKDLNLATVRNGVIVPAELKNKYDGKMVWEMGDLAIGAVISNTMSLPGAQIGAFVQVSTSAPTLGVLFYGSVSQQGSIALYANNQTAAIAHLGTMNIYVTAENRNV